MQLDGNIHPVDDLCAEEFLKITKLPPETRFDYFIEYAVKHNQLWGLFGTNGWVMVDSDDELCLPIWPHKDYVTAWERDDFPECEPKPIPLEDFKNQWAKGLDKNNTLLLLFPCGEEEEGIVMSASEFVTSLEEVA